MKFETTFDFLKALVDNDGVLYSEKGHEFFIDKTARLDGLLFSIGAVCSVLELEWFTTEPLKDKDPVEAWNNGHLFTRSFGFYDAENKSLFNPDGRRNGRNFDNYRKLDNVPEWMVEAQKSLKD